MMYETSDILTTAYRQPVIADQLAPLREKHQQIPGSVRYSIKRYSRNIEWNLDDMGEMVYHYSKEDATQNVLELRFCIAGNAYCRRHNVRAPSGTAGGLA